jgi:hypothetical protein
MRKQHLSIVAAAALAVAGMGWSTARAADDTSAAPSAGQQIENAANKTGDAIKSGAEKTGEAVQSGAEKTGDALHLNKNASADQSKNAEQIRDVLAQVAQALTTKAGLDDLAERFADTDRSRLNQNKDALKNNPTLDGRIAEFQKDWKAKYNQDFGIKEQAKVFDNSFAMISQGAEAGAARAAGEKIDSSTPATPGATSDKTGAAAPNATPDSNAADRSRNVAIVSIAASHDQPAVTVPMIHEAGGWKLDIPDSVDATKLRDNVLAALTKCDEMKDQWPADVNDAYRFVTHSVLLAIYPAASDSAQPAAGQLPPDQGARQPGQQPEAPAQPAQPATPSR